MDFFVTDTVGDTGNSGSKKQQKAQFAIPYLSIYDGSASVPVVSKQEVEEEESDDDDDYGGLPPPGVNLSKILSKATDDLSVVLSSKKMRRKMAVFRADTSASKSKTGCVRRGITQENELNQTDVNAEMQKAVLNPSIERKEDIACLAMNDYKLQKLNRAERDKTKGRNWFNMAAPEMTPELSNELQLIRMRSVLDPKKVFGRVEKRKAPKYFEVGTVVASPLDYYNERGIKKSKKQSLVDELLADAEFQKFNKRKYAEALEKKKKKAYHKAVMKMKKEKKRK